MEKEKELQYLKVNPVARNAKGGLEMGRWPNTHVDDGTDDDTVMDHINNQHETL